MSLIDLAAIPQLERLNEEAHLICKALESIAKSLLTLTELAPGPETPEKPIGPEAIGSYAHAIVDAESAEDMREMLRKSGLGDVEIEDQIVKMIFQGSEEEGTD